MSLQHKEKVKDREGSERQILNHVQNCCSRINYGNPSNWTEKEKVLCKKELILWANILVICLRIMRIVSKSQLGKHGVYLKVIRVKTRIKFNILYHNTSSIWKLNFYFIAIIFFSNLDNHAFYNNKCCYFHGTFKITFIAWDCFYSMRMFCLELYHGQSK